MFAKCETNSTGNGSSRWFEITKRKLFNPQDFTFNPKRTNVPKNWTEALYDADHSTFSISVTTVIGAAGGATAFFLLLLILVILLLRKVKKQREEIEMTNEEIDEFMLGIAAEKASAKGINGLFVLPYDTRLEIPKSDVTFRKN